MDNIIIFVKETTKETLDLPENCEGIFCPIKFDIKEYNQWKLKEKQSYLEGEDSIIDNIFEVINRSFSTKTDFDYMVYSRFLTDPKNMDTGEDLTDTNARFGSSSLCEIWKQFIVLFRSCIFNGGGTSLVPEPIMKDLSKTFEAKGSTETQLNYDKIPKDLWKSMYTWKVMRNFITNRASLFPKIEDLLRVYGPIDKGGILKDLEEFNGCFVDVINKEDSEEIIKTLEGKFNIESFQA